MKHVFPATACCLGILALLSSSALATSFAVSSSASLGGSPDRHGFNPTYSTVVNETSTAKRSHTFSIEQSGFYSWEFQVPSAYLSVNFANEDFPDPLFMDDPIEVQQQAWQAYIDSLSITAEIMGEILVNDELMGSYGAQVGHESYSTIGAMPDLPPNRFNPLETQVSWQNLTLSFDIGWLEAGNIDVTMLLSSSISGMGIMNAGTAFISASYDRFGSLKVNRNPIPEPGTVLLFSAGLVGLAGRLRKK